MFEYENFIVKSYSYTESAYSSASAETVETPEEKAIRTGNRYLRMHCTLDDGFPDEAHHFQNLEKPIKMIPSVFTNALVLPLLYEMDEHKRRALHLANLLLKNRHISGTWNYFGKTGDISRNLFPNDTDDTSLALAALYKMDLVTQADCQQTALKMIGHFNSSQRGKENEVGIWLPPSTDTTEESNIIMKKLLHPPRPDVGSIANTLWFFTLIHVDEEPGLQRPTLYIRDFLLRHKKNAEKVIDGMSYYTNRFVLYYLISRYLNSNNEARILMLDDLSCLVKCAMDTMLEQDFAKALDIACVVLAAFNLELHLPGNSFDYINVSEQIRWLLRKLVSLQMSNGSFQPWNVFRWNKIGFYGGSCSITTSFALAAIQKAKSVGILIN